MSNKTPLLGENVIFTGILRSSEASDLVERFGGNAVIAPMIATKEIVSSHDLDQLQSCNLYDWLIFTSQSSVKAFHSKMVKYQLDASFFKAKIAVVGTKTANAIEKLGFQSILLLLYLVQIYLFRNFRKLHLPLNDVYLLKEILRKIQ